MAFKLYKTRERNEEDLTLGVQVAIRELASPTRIHLMAD